jgi:hypothetical protein
VKGIARRMKSKTVIDNGQKLRIAERRGIVFYRPPDDPSLGILDVAKSTICGEQLLALRCRAAERQ